MAPLTVTALVYPDNLAALGVCRSLGRRGIPVTVAASDRSAPGQYSRYARRLPCPPLAHEDEFIACLVRHGRGEGHRPVLFPTDDPTLLVVSKHRALLEEFYRIPMSPWPVIQEMIFKDRLYESLDGVVPVPRTRTLSDEGELAAALSEIGTPAVAKPTLRCLPAADGEARRPFDTHFGGKAVRIRDLADLQRAFAAAHANGFTLLLQEEIPGPVSSLYSVAAYATRAGTCVSFTARKLAQVPADFGDGLIVQAIAAPDVVPLAMRALRHFGFHGMADIEFKWDARDGVYKLLDINPRPWLWINLPTACGVDLPYAAYLDAMEGSLVPSAFTQRDFRTRWVSMRGLLVHLVRSLRGMPSGVGLGTLLAELRGPRIGPLLAWDDVLLKMFFSPRYWRESLGQAARSVRELPAATAGRVSC
jgi:D-aspartate ligase